MNERYKIVPVMGHYEIKDTYNNIIVGSGDTYREAADVLLELSQSIN